METVITDVVASIQAVESDIVTIGGAIIVVAAAVMAIRWIKAQFF